MMRHIARTMYRRRRAVVGLWIAALVGISALSGAFGGTFRDVIELPGSESQEAFELLEEHGMEARSGFSGQVVFTADDVDDPTVRSGMETLFAELEAAVVGSEVVGGFALGDERALQMFGLGLAVAIAIDATIVRLVIVPSTMELLGDRNWWLPRWLDRILPRADLEGAAAGDDGPAGTPDERRLARDERAVTPVG